MTIALGCPAAAVESWKIITTLTSKLNMKIFLQPKIVRSARLSIKYEREIRVSPVMQLEWAVTQREGAGGPGRGGGQVALGHLSVPLRGPDGLCRGGGGGRGTAEAARRSVGAKEPPLEE